MQRSSNGVLVLVLGILSWTGLTCFTGLPAWIIGNSALKDIDSGRADPTDRNLVQIGRILGMVNCIIVFIGGGIWLLFVVGIIGLGVFGATANHP